MDNSYILGALLAFALLPVNASAVTIRMEDVAPVAGVTTESDSTKNFEGFDLFVSHGHYIDSAWSPVGTTRASNGTDYLAVDTLSPMILTRTGGSLFTITSFDATDLFTDSNYVPFLEFNVTGELSGGGTLFASFTSDSSLAFETFVFGSEWTNLVSVSFGGNQTHGAYDNIVVFSAVPIPPAFWLFGPGLLGLIGLSRRKKAAL